MMFLLDTNAFSDLMTEAFEANIDARMAFSRSCQ